LFPLVFDFVCDFVADGDCMPGCASGLPRMLSCAASGAANASGDAAATIKASILIGNLLIPLVGNNPFVEHWFLLPLNLLEDERSFIRRPQKIRADDQRTAAPRRTHAARGHQKNREAP
jgi:hypothetical protein